MAQLDDRSRELVDRSRFATVATLDADGSPHTSLVWIERDGDQILFSTTAQRRKGRNLRRDPRISVTVFDLDDPYRTVDIAGVAELVDDPGKTLPQRLARKYLGHDPPEESADVLRVIVRVTAHRITGWGS